MKYPKINIIGILVVAVLSVIGAISGLICVLGDDPVGQKTMEENYLLDYLKSNRATILWYSERRERLEFANGDYFIVLGDTLIFNRMGK